MVTRKSSKRARSANPASAKLDDDWPDKLLDEMMESSASLSRDEIERLENFINESGVTRRIALVTLSKPFREVRAMVEGDRDFAVAVADALECIDVETYRALADNLSAARTWMMMALACREDMDAVINEAKLRGADSEAGRGLQ